MAFDKVITVLNKLLGIDFTRVDDTQKHELGIELDCSDGKRRKYIRAGADIAARDILICDYAEGPNDFQPSSAVAQPIEGIAEVDIADNKFGWVIVGGAEVAAKLAGSPSAGSKIGTFSTAGTGAVIDVSASPSQSEVRGVIAAAAGRSVIVTSSGKVRIF